MSKSRPDNQTRRRWSALERREADLARYMQGDFTNAGAHLGANSIAGAKEDISNLKAKLKGGTYNG